MKFNKNMLALATCFAITTPVICDDLHDTAIDRANQHIATTYENKVMHEVSAEDATDILQAFAATLHDNDTFNVYNQSFNVTTSRALNSAQQAIIESILSQVVNSAISTISEQIQSAQEHTISQQDAITLLQNYAQSLVPGAVFELNNTTYTVVANKTVHDETNPQEITLEQAREIFNSQEAEEFLATKNVTPEQAYTYMAELLQQIKDSCIEINGTIVHVDGISFTINNNYYIVKPTEVVVEDSYEDDSYEDDYSNDYESEEDYIENNVADEYVSVEEEQALVEAVIEATCQVDEQAAIEDAIETAEELLDNNSNNADNDEFVDAVITSDDSGDVIIETYATTDEDSEVIE